MLATRPPGSYNDGYAENLSFQVIPEPSLFLLPAMLFLFALRNRFSNFRNRSGPPRLIRSTNVRPHRAGLAQRTMEKPARMVVERSL